MFKTGAFLDGMQQEELYQQKKTERDHINKQREIQNETSLNRLDRTKQAQEWQDKQRDAKIKLFQKQYNTMATNTIDTALVEAGHGNFDNLKKVLLNTGANNMNSDVKRELESQLGGRIIDVRLPERTEIEDNDDEISDDEVTIEYITESGERAHRRMSLSALGGQLGTDRRVGAKKFHEAMAQPYASNKNSKMDDAIKASINFNGTVKDLQTNLFYAGVVGGDKDSKELLDLIKEQGAKDSATLLEVYATQYNKEQDPQKRKELLKKIEKTKSLMDKINPPKSSVDAQKAKAMQDIMTLVKSGSESDLAKAKLLMDTLQGVSKALKPSKGKDLAIEQAVELAKRGKVSEAIRTSLLGGGAKATDLIRTSMVDAVMKGDFTTASNIRRAIDPQGKDDVINVMMDMKEQGKSEQEIKRYAALFGVGVAAKPKLTATQIDRAERKEMAKALNGKLSSGTGTVEDITNALAEVPQAQKKVAAGLAYDVYRESASYKKQLDLRAPELRTGALTEKGQAELKKLYALQRVANPNMSSKLIAESTKQLGGVITAVSTYDNVIKTIDKLKKSDMYTKMRSTGVGLKVDQYVKRFFGDMFGGNYELARKSHSDAQGMVAMMDEIESLQRSKTEGKKIDSKRLSELKKKFENDTKVRFETSTFFVLKKMLNAISGMGVTNQELDSYKIASMGKDFDSIDTMRDRLAETTVAYTQQSLGAFDTLNSEGAYGTAMDMTLDLRRAGTYVFGTAKPDADISRNLQRGVKTIRPEVVDNTGRMTDVGNKTGLGTPRVQKIATDINSFIKTNKPLSELQGYYHLTASDLTEYKSVYKELYRDLGQTKQQPQQKPKPVKATPVSKSSAKAQAVSKEQSGDFDGITASTMHYIDYNKLEGLEHTKDDGFGREAWGAVDAEHSPKEFKALQNGTMTPEEANQAVFEREVGKFNKIVPLAKGWKPITREFASILAVNAGAGRYAYTDKDGKRHKANGAVAFMPTLKLIEAGKYDDAIRHIKNPKIHISPNHRRNLVAMIEKAKAEEGGNAK